MSQTGVRISALISETNTISTTQREAWRLAERMLHLLDRPRLRSGREYSQGGSGIRFCRDKNGLLTIRCQQQELTVPLSPDKGNRLKKRANIARLSSKLLVNELIRHSMSSQL